MGRIDKLHLDFPFAGSRMLRDFLRGEGFKIGRCHVIPVPANREFSMNAAVLRELERLDAA